LEKRDPYDEEEELTKVLQGSDPARSNDLSRDIQEVLATRVKTELAEDNYEPSSELVSLLSEHPSDNSSNQNVPEARIKLEEDYHPSKELQTAIADHFALANERISLGEAKRKERPIKYGNDEPHLKRIKQEYP